MLPGYPLLLASASIDSVALANSAVATTILAPGGLATMPAGILQFGSALKILLRGRISTLATTPGTLTFDLRIGGVVVSALGAMPLNVSAQTNSIFELELLAVVRALGTGTGANAMVTGRFTSRAMVGSVLPANGGPMTIILPDTAPVVGPGFDSTISMPVNVFATWSVASASNSIQTHQSIAELKV